MERQKLKSKAGGQGDDRLVVLFRSYYTLSCLRQARRISDEASERKRALCAVDTALLRFAAFGPLCPAVYCF